MGNLKWYSGGNERQKAVETIITDLLIDLKMDLRNDSLHKILEKYLEELRQKSTSIPMILSRMNIDISKAIKKDEFILSKYQSEKLKELISISSIRYGY